MSRFYPLQSIFADGSIGVDIPPQNFSSPFKRIQGLTLNAGEDDLQTAVIDTVNGFAYFGTFTYPGIVVKVNE